MNGRPSLRVGFYLDATHWWGGAEVFLANLLGFLGPHVRATVLGLSAAHVQRLVACRPGTDGVVLQPAHRMSDLRGLLAHRRAIAGLRLDILQVNVASMLSCQEALAAAATIPRLRILAVEHLPEQLGLRGRLVKHVTSRNLHAHVGVGESTARFVEAEASLPKGSVRTIHNGVPDPGPPPRRFPSADLPVIGCLARLERRKGVDVLLQAVAGISNARLVVAGEGDELRPALKKQAAALGTGRVQILDRTERPRELLETCDIFVLPSRAEAFPLSIVEAMLAALPVVATNVGSVREAVTDAVTGFVVSPDDVNGLRRALRLLVDEPDLRLQMGTAGRRRAQEHFTAPVMASAYENLYEELLSRSGGVPARANG